MKRQRTQDELPAWQELPATVVVHTARQVGVPPGLYPSYEWSGRTIKYHRVQIWEFLGFREAIVRGGDQLVAWLVARVMRRIVGAA
jgi:Domain of unknown function (DUF4158)